MINMLLKRRSCRKFEDRAVEAEKKEKLLQAAQLGPSGKNIRPWEFVVIENKEILKKLPECRNPKQPFLADAALAVVMLGNTQKTDTWIEDCSIAAIALQLEAEKLSLGSCWVQVRMRESSHEMSTEAYLRELLGIPEHMSVLSIIAVGYPAETRPAHTLDEINWERVHSDVYGSRK